MTQVRKVPRFDCTFLHTTTEERSRKHKEWRVKCPMCGFSGPWCTTERDAMVAVANQIGRNSPLS